jgi:hypothetical protein
MSHFHLSPYGLTALGVLMQILCSKLSSAVEDQSWQICLDRRLSVFPLLSYECLKFPSLFLFDVAQMSVSTSGFALRFNGSCQAKEVDCGTTVAPYHACCPASSVCPSQYNVDVSHKSVIILQFSSRFTVLPVCCQLHSYSITRSAMRKPDMGSLRQWRILLL